MNAVRGVGAQRRREGLACGVRIRIKYWPTLCCRNTLKVVELGIDAPHEHSHIFIADAIAGVSGKLREVERRFLDGCRQVAGGVVDTVRATQKTASLSGCDR